MLDVLRVFSLNIEGEKHLDLWLPFIQTERPDVVFLQEVPMHLVETIGRTLGMRPVRHDAMAQTSVWGLACYVQENILVAAHKSIGYDVPGMVGVPCDTSPSDDVFRYLQCIEVAKGDAHYNLVQTHFTWSPDGFPNTRQIRAYERMSYLLTQQHDLVLFGDLNAPRGINDIWGLLATKYTDNIPGSVLSTLDEKIHRVGHLQRVVDMCFSTGAYAVPEIKVIPGLSDHKGVLATIQIASE